MLMVWYWSGNGAAAAAVVAERKCEFELEVGNRTLLTQ